MRRTLLTLAAGAGLALAGTALHAQGSSVGTHSACATGRALASVAAPCGDASAIFYNPAALHRDGTALGLGLSAIVTGGEFEYDAGGPVIDRETAVVPVPHGFASYRFNDRMTAGIGVWAPYGLGIEWPLEFEGRYVGYDNSLRALYIQPTLSVALADWFMLGGGVDVVLGSIEINQRVDLATATIAQHPQLGPLTGAHFGIPTGTDFADARLSGNGTGVTWHIGMLADLTPDFSVGFRYLHQVTTTFDDGTAEFTPVQTGITLAPNNPFGAPGGTPLDAVVAPAFQDALRNQAVRTEITFPNQAVIGFAYRGIPGLGLMADVQFTGWSTFWQFPLDFDEAALDSDLILDYNDAWTYRIGGEYDLTPAFVLRGGFIYNTAATPDETVTPLLPEAERNYITAGLGWRIMPGLRADFGYQWINQADRRGRVTGRPDRTFAAEDLNVGLYSTMGHVFGLTVAYQPGGVR